MVDSFNSKCRKLENAIAVYKLAKETYFDDLQNTNARDDYNQCADYIIELCREISLDNEEV